MKNQLLLLLELQELDTKVQEARAAIKALPAKLEPAKKDLAKLEAMLQQEKARLQETETWRTDQESIIKQDEEAVRKAKTKLQAARNTRDYAAASREIDNKRRSMSEREDEVLKVIDALEKSRSEMEAHDKDVETLREHIREQEAALRSKTEELEAEAQSLESGRANLTEKIEPPLLKRYQVVLEKRGYAVALVDNGVCRGCHMSVPPQLNNILASGTSIESCPRCQRLLYRKELLGEEAEEVAS